MSQLFVDNIKNRTGGALGLPGGVIVTGVGTITGDLSVSGTLTYEDVTNIDSIGIITARSHVSIADSILHTGDTDTAIRFPSAGTFTVETNGSQALEIDSSQRINVGGAAVSQTRTVNIGSNAEANLAIETHNDATSETANIRFYKSGNTAASPQIVEANDNIAQLLFYGHDGTDYANAAAVIKASVDGTPGSNDMPGMLQFHTNPGTTGTTERLRLTSGGGIHFSNGELLERVNITAGKLSDNANINLDNGMVHYFTTQESTTSTPNIISSVGIDTTMATGDTMAVTIITTAAAGGYSARVSIDGLLTGITTSWVGGSEPSAGGSSGVDIYNYTIIKTGSAAYQVIGNYTATS